MSKANAIAVEELRVGMFVQLEGGWLSHPFPLSAFKLCNAEQIETLRGLGLGQVRWVPEKSDLPTPAAPPLDHAVATQGTENTEKAPAELRASSWQQQRESALRCEAQRSRVENELRQLMSTAAARPLEAGRASVALTQSMLDDMLDEDEVGIRLVNTGPDRALAHALNVSVISLLIGRMLGMSAADLLDVGVGALLHDAGKTRIGGPSPPAAGRANRH